MLNREELAVGAAYGVWLAVFIKLWALPIACVTAFLWAYGGADNTSKGWRRIGVPAVNAIVLAHFLHSLGHSTPFLGLSAVLAWGVLSIGYGIPSINDPGSTIGKWVFRKIVNGEVGSSEDEHKATLIVRSLLAFLFGVCFLYPLLPVLGNFILGIVILVVMVLSVIALSDQFQELDNM